MYVIWSDVASIILKTRNCRKIFKSKRCNCESPCHHKMLLQDFNYDLWISAYRSSNTWIHKQIMVIQIWYKIKWCLCFEEWNETCMLIWEHKCCLQKKFIVKVWPQINIQTVAKQSVDQKKYRSFKVAPEPHVTYQHQWFKIENIPGSLNRVWFNQWSKNCVCNAPIWCQTHINKNIYQH